MYANVYDYYVMKFSSVVANKDSAHDTLQQYLTFFYLICTVP